MFAARFGNADCFFKNHFVVNYCPLGFLQAGGANLTPDKLRNSDRTALFAACDEHLRAVLEILAPRWVIGIGAFAAARARLVVAPRTNVGQILHPSPASPAANRNWAAQAQDQLRTLGVWD